MRGRPLVSLATVCLCVWTAQSRVSGQTVELVGSRALGMGGAFVAVASDSSATWWNPAGLAAGPFFDMALARAAVETSDRLPAWRQKSSGFALGTPPVGLSYYRFRITDIQPFDSTDRGVPVREEGVAEVPVRSLSASQFGLTVVQTLIPGVHSGATLKYLRGTVHSLREPGAATPTALLDRGESVDAGDAEGRFDLDVGILAVAGVVRLGANVRNVRESEFDGGMKLSRQTRVGVAFDPEPVTGVPLTVALDADVGTYETASGPRRVVAVGAEHWLLNERLGLRAGGRINTAGARERAGTLGASAAVRAGMYIDGHVVRGGPADEKGWGVAARVSF